MEVIGSHNKTAMKLSARSADKRIMECSRIACHRLMETEALHSTLTVFIAKNLLEEST